MFDPISAGVGIISGGLGIFQGIAQAKAQKQDYMNQVAFQNANTKFNKWQAGFNARMTNASAQYNYWASTINHNSELAYTAQLRNYDLSQEIAQAKRVAETRTGAQVNYLVNSEALGQKFAEEGMQQAVAMQQAQYRMLQQSSAFQAMAGEGQSVDRIINNYTRQIGDYETLATINEGLKNRQYKRDQLSQVTQYLSQYNSQDFFRAMERMSPIAPFAPLPSLLTPPPPSMTGAAPGGVSPIAIGSGILGGVNAYLNTSAAIKNLK